MPIQVNDAFWNSLKQAAGEEKQSIHIDLPNQTVEIDNGPKTGFEIDAFRKECILKGYTDLDYLVSIQQKITQFEEDHPVPRISFYE